MSLRPPSGSSTVSSSTSTSASTAVVEGPDADAVVAECWRQIRALQQSMNTFPDTSPTTLLERVVRVFVSSTFVDMHSEREALSKQVFPELRAWCARLNLSLAEVDLRWGVPAGSQAETTINACMQEIDRCIQSNQQPFFVSLLGHRYGWVPDLDELKPDFKVHLLKQYAWVPGVSITHMEVQYGAYSRHNPNAVFMMRDGHSYDQLAADKLKGVVDSNDLPKKHMKELKHRLQRRFPDQCHRYKAKLIGVENNRVQFSGLRGEKFAGVITASLKKAILRQYNLQEIEQEELSKDEQAAQTVAHVVQRHQLHFVGRQTALDTLLACCQRQDSARPDTGYTTDSDQTSTSDETIRSDVVDLTGVLVRKLEITEEAQALQSSQYNRRIFWLTGEPGVGKTALIANLLPLLPEASTFVHFCDESAVTRQVSVLLGRLLCWSGAKPKQEESDDETPNVKELGDLFRGDGLRALRSRTRPTSKQQRYIFIDAVDKLSNKDSVDRLEWLPARVPGNVTLLVSSSDLHVPTTYQLKIRGPARIQLAGLNHVDQQLFAIKFFSHFGKRLDDQQMDALLAIHDTCTPLWLSVALEELRVYGHFDRLTELIGRLPDELQTLLLMVLRRVMDEDNDMQKSRLLLLLLCCALDEDVLDEQAVGLMLGDVKANERAPPLLLSRTRIALQQVLYTAHNGTYRLHPLAKTVLLRDVFDASRVRYGHQLLADYLGLRHADLRRVADLYPRHCIAAGNTQAAGQFLVNDRRAMMMSTWHRSDLCRSVRCAAPVHNGTPLFVCRFCRPDSRWCVYCQDRQATAAATHCLKHLKQPQPRCLFCAKPVDKEGRLGGEAKLCQRCARPNQPQCAQPLFKL